MRQVMLSILCCLGSGPWLAESAGCTEPTAPRPYQTYYVAPDGDDDSPGTLERPFATLERARIAVSSANATMTGDIVVYLREGEYFLGQPLTLLAADSGANGHDVIYASHPGEQATLHGAIEIGGWQVHDVQRNIWSAEVPRGTRTRQLYIGGRRATRARSEDGQLIWSVAGTDRFTSQPVLGEAAASDLEFVFTGAASGARAWVELRCRGHSTEQGEWEMVAPCFANALSQDASPGLRVPTSVENGYALMDAPGEWYLDSAQGRIYYLPRAEEMLDAHFVARAPVTERLLQGRDLAHVRFRDLRFRHATWMGAEDESGFVSEQADSLLIGNPATRQPVPANIDFQNSHHIAFEGNAFSQLGSTALSFDVLSTNVTISANDFTDISGSGLRLGALASPSLDTEYNAAAHVVRDNVVTHVGVEYRGSIGILVGCVSDVEISHNEIAHLPYTALSLGWGWGERPCGRSNRVAHNLIHHYTQVLSDGGGVYTLSPQGSSRKDRTLISQNYIHDGMNPYAAIYLDEGSSWITAESNVIAKVPWWLLINGTSTPEFIGNHHITVQDNYYDAGECQNNLHPARECLTDASGNALYFSNNGPSGSAGPVSAASIIAAAGPAPSEMALQHRGEHALRAPPP
jgi:Right handed beta helix region